MVLVLRTISVGQADYYLHPPAAGRWMGTGSPGLGLTDPVDTRSLQAVLAGRDPGGPSLVPSRVDRRAGFDLIMATPKSVSLLAALGPADRAQLVTAAHDQAVTATLGYLERNAAWTRRGRADVRIPTDGLIAAAFGHRWSAAGDPHLHTHVVLANLVRGDDGRWSCLDSRALYRHAGAAGAVFQASLRHAMARQGFNLMWNVSREGLGDIVGVPRPAIDAVSLRQRQVTEEIQSGLAGSKGRATAAGRTRAQSRLQPPARAWDVRVSSAGFDRARAATLLQGLAGHEPLARRAPAHSATAGVLSERSSRFQRQDVVRAVATLTTAGAAPPLLEQWADDFLGTALAAGDETWTTPGLRRLDERITSLATDPTRSGVGVARVQALDDALGRRADLTRSGQEALRRLTIGGARVDLVRGELMGQAWVLDAARAVWESSGHRVALVSRSDRGAARWQALTGIGPLPGAPAHATVLVVDGADRWPTQALHRMISDADARSTKVVLVDGGTTAPKRRAESPAVESLRATLAVVDCGQAPAWEPPSAAVGLRTGNDGSVTLAASGPASAHLLVDEWHRSTAEGRHPRMLALGPEEAEYLNSRARLVRARAGELGGPALVVAGRPFQVADQVMALRAATALGPARSGAVGTVVAVDVRDQQLTIRWPTGDVVLSPPALSRAPLTHGYATTPPYLRDHDGGPVLALGDPDRLSPGLKPNQIFTIMPVPSSPDRADPLRELLAELQHHHPQPSHHPAETARRTLMGPPADAAWPLADLCAERDRLSTELRATAPPDPRPELRRMGEEREWLLAAPNLGERSQAQAGLDRRGPPLAAAVQARARWLEAHREPLERWDQLSIAIAWREQALGYGAESRPSRAVMAEVGAPPDDSGARSTWRQAAGAIEAYRERWALPDEPLGLVPAAGEIHPSTPADRHAEELRVVASCRTLRHAYERDRSLARS